MIYLSTLILGLVQGLAEFLPISSSGHLIIFKSFLPDLGELAADMTFDVLLHLGTLAAVFICYRKTILSMIVEFCVMLKKLVTGHFKFKDANRYQLMSIYVIVATLPLGIIALVHDAIEASMSNLLVVGIMLFVTAALLFIADRSVPGKKDIHSMNTGRALKLGLFQAIATIPGLSRSGTTISAGINMGFNRETAVEFSFIMAIPAIIGANILKIKEVVSKGFDLSMLGPCALGVFVAALSGIAAIRLVRYITKTNKFGYFIGYCCLAGCVAIALNFLL